MFNAIRSWVGSQLELALHGLVTYRRDDDRHCGFVRVYRVWFEFTSRRLQTADGLRLVTSFYLVVGGPEAQQIREQQRPAYPRSEAGTTSSWAETKQAAIRLLMRSGEREVLNDRVFAIEGASPEDFDASLGEAIEALQREFRRKLTQGQKDVVSAARALRDERMHEAALAADDVDEQEVHLEPPSSPHGVVAWSCSGRPYGSIGTSAPRRPESALA